MISVAELQRARASDAILLSSKQGNEHQNGAVQKQIRSILVVDTRALDRECLAQTLVTAGDGIEVQTCASINEWRTQKGSRTNFSAILLHTGSRRVTDPAVAEEIEKLVREFKPAPVLVLGDSDDIMQVLRALEIGARGYVPSSVGIQVCLEAIDLALAGGVFVPASSLVGMRHRLETGVTASPPLGGMFTERQAEVVEALRRGKANKIIAYELKLRESTVKVHIRNIMKKLKATNRTEVACKVNDLFPVEPRYHETAMYA